MSEEFNYEDMIDEGMPNVEEVSAPNVPIQQEQEITPVKLSKGKVLAILIFGIVILIFVLIVLDGVSIKKNTGTPVQKTEVSETAQQSVSPTVSNGGDVSSEISESSVVSSESTLSSSEETNSSVSTSIEETVEVVSDESILIQGEVIEQKEDEVVSKAEFEHLEVEPMLGAEITVSGMVKGKSMYRVKDSYTYGVNLILITGNDTNLECTYFCPKKTADALNIGDSLNVIYACDSNGNVCVVSISK